MTCSDRIIEYTTKKKHTHSSNAKDSRTQVKNNSVKETGIVEYISKI